jgi:hypothetical protein
VHETDRHAYHQRRPDSLFDDHAIQFQQGDRRVADQRDPSIQDRRDHARFIPEIPHSTLLFADGSSCPCFIIDISVSGVAVSSTAQPELGTPLSVGACVGRVTRIFADGFAIRFVEQQRRIDVERLVTHAPKTLPTRVAANAPRLQRLQKMG